MLDESICHFRCVGSILSLLFYFFSIGSILSLLFYMYFRLNILLANNVGPDQMPHYVASDLGLHCLPITVYWFPGKHGLRLNYKGIKRK